MSFILKGVQATRIFQVQLVSNLEVGLELFSLSFQVSEFLSIWLRQLRFLHLLITTTLLFFLFDRRNRLFLYRYRLSGDDWDTRNKLLAARVALAYLMALVDKL